jgi:ribosome-binding protein aMBF1 (putative translation factor)
MAAGVAAASDHRVAAHPQLVREGEWVRSERERLGLTQRELGERVHRAGQCISDVEGGRRQLSDGLRANLARVFAR